MNRIIKKTFVVLCILALFLWGLKWRNTLLTFDDFFIINDKHADQGFTPILDGCNTEKYHLNIRFERMLVSFNGRVDIEETHHENAAQLVYSGPYSKDIVFSVCREFPIDSLQLRILFIKDNKVCFSHSEKSIAAKKHITANIRSAGVPSVAHQLE